jgi:aromatic-amino-acid transaminase
MAPASAFQRLLIRPLLGIQMSSLFDAVEMAPRDPILGISEQFASDPNPNKVNLSVGRLLRRERQAAVARVRARAEAR